MRHAALVGTAVLLFACGARDGAAVGSAASGSFACEGRQVEYAVAGGFVADEAGVILQCSGGSPRLVQWRLEGSGERARDTHQLSADEFDTLWRKIESTGWRNLGDCDNPAAADDDPVYMIDIANHSHSISVTCQGKARELPFPYDRIVNELDLKAAGMGGVHTL